MGNWYDFPRWRNEFEEGLDEYLKTAFATRAHGEQIACPCQKCCYRYWFRDSHVVKDHVIANGFIPRLEKTPKSHVNVEVTPNENVGGFINDDMGGLLHDTFIADLDGETKTFYKLVEEGEQELYPGCKNFSKLSFTIRLFLFKCDHKLSNSAFGDLLKLLTDMQPEAKLPRSFNEANNTLKGLGLSYTKIDACPNDCMLYWEEHAEETQSHVCKTPRWKSDDRDEKTGKPRQIPQKILRYFRVTKRLQRLFLCSTTARDMTWHANGRPKDNLLRHPADGKSWKDFDMAFPKFAEEHRNVRLGLATDGFNPFDTMSVSHSTWPVILMNYNLPPWICMKPEFFMLALLIPGPQSPGRNIDVYKKPLIKELTELWVSGVDTFDVSTKQRFRMHAALLFTVTDFPALSMLCGWSTKGKKACPCCHYETCSKYLIKSRKTCYMGRCRFSNINDPWRRSDVSKMMVEESTAVAPTRLSGAEISKLLAGFENNFGKLEDNRKRKKSDDDNPWKKKSIFFDLPYWKSISCPHYLDVMHIEKNICDNVIGTLLDIPGKTKDHLNARKDLEVLNIMPKLHPVEDANGKFEIPKAKFSMTIEQKRTFCRVIKSARLPQDCGSNIARCVQVAERKIFGYKSHDAHLLLQHLLPVAAAVTLHKDVAFPLIRLGSFFRGVCRKVIDPAELDQLQSDIVLTLCEFEGIFPPAFFDVMIHLSVHLVDEIKLGGPVSPRWMFSIERYLRVLKSYVRNKNRPEGSIAEGYIAKECVTFCDRYLSEDIEASRAASEDVEDNETSNILPTVGSPIRSQRNSKSGHNPCKIDVVTWAQAHRYVLYNCNSVEIERYIKEHEMLVSQRKKRKWDTTNIHIRNFSDWFKEKVWDELGKGEEVADHIKWLSKGPSLIVKKYTGYFVNGFKFHTVNRDANSMTENSGVTLTSLTPCFSSSKDQNPTLGDVTYYGSIQEIIEIYYRDNNSVVLFRCRWFHSEKDEYGLSRVNQNKSIYQQDPFIFASQANQVYFVEDPRRQGWYFAVKNLPRETF